MLGVDDAHVLDAASAALVRHLTETGTCFLVVTVRSNEPTPDAVVSLWKDGPVDRIELRSLSEKELAELVVAGLEAHVDGATLHRLWEASRGNVLYLRELVLGGIAEGTLAQERGVWRWRGPLVATALLTELVDSRLGELTPAQRGVLEIVAHAEPIEGAFLDALTEAAEREAVERRGLLDTDLERPPAAGGAVPSPVRRGGSGEHPAVDGEADLEPSRRPVAGERSPSER